MAFFVEYFTVLGDSPGAVSPEQIVEADKFVAKTNSAIDVLIQAARLTHSVRNIYVTYSN